MNHSEQIRHHRFLESTFWKVLGVASMCILEFLVIGALFTAFWSAALKSHSKTDLIREQMGSKTFEVVSDLAEGSQPLTDPSETNLRFTVNEVNEDGKETELLDTSSDEESLRKEIFWLCVRGDSAAPWIASKEEVQKLTKAEWTEVSVYQCTVTLVTPFTAKDDISSLCATMDFAEKHGRYAIPAAICFTIILILILVYEFCAAGHRKGKDGITLLAIDYCPFDLGTFLMAIFTFICLPTAGAIVDMTSSLEEINTAMLATLAALSLAWSLVFFTYLMSLARRVKTKRVLKGTLIGWVCKKLVSLGKFLGELLPEFWQRLIVLALYLIMQFGASAAIGRVEGIIFFLVSAVIGGTVLHSLWMQKQTCIASEELCGGNLNYQISEQTIEKMYGGMRSQAENLNQIRDTVAQAVDKQVKSERLKTELIANVGHDIRTPLTSIINYVDLLGKDHTAEQEKEYLDVLSRQTKRLQKLTEDVLESSKADSGNVEVHLEKTSVAEIVDQAYGEYEEKMAQAELETVINVPEDLYVTADGRLLWRILRNLLSNAAKYSAPKSRVYVVARKTDAKDENQVSENQVSIEIKNVSREKLNISADELMERFVRGDSSRHSEGSGLGLDIARSLCSLMGGRLDIQIDGDLFKAAVILKAA